LTSKVWEKFFGLFGPFLAFVVVTRIEIIVFQRNQIEIGGKKLTVLQKKCPYAFCFFSKIVDNILWGGASFEIREFFCRV